MVHRERLAPEAADGCCQSDNMPSPAQPHRNPPSERAALVFAIASILVFLGFSVWFWVQAPENVATHFDSG